MLGNKRARAFPALHAPRASPPSKSTSCHSDVERWSMKRSTPDDVDDDGRYGAGKKIDLSWQRGDGSVVDWILREALLQQGSMHTVCILD